MRQQQVLQLAEAAVEVVALNNDRPWVSIASPGTRSAIARPYRSNGYGPNDRSKNVELLVGDVEIRLRCVSARSASTTWTRSTPLDAGAAVDQLVAAGEERDEVRRHRLGPAPSARSCRRERSSAGEPAVGHGREPVGDGDRERPRRLVGRVVVARQPGAGAVGFVDRPDAVARRSPRTRRPPSKKSGLEAPAIELDGHLERVAGPPRRGEIDDQLTAFHAVIGVSAVHPRRRRRPARRDRGRSGRCRPAGCPRSRPFRRATVARGRTSAPTS